jgi:hypothetical protein
MGPNPLVLPTESPPPPEPTAVPDGPPYDLDRISRSYRLPPPDERRTGKVYMVFRGSPAGIYGKWYAVFTVVATSNKILHT